MQMLPLIKIDVCVDVHVSSVDVALIQGFQLRPLLHYTLNNSRSLRTSFDAR